MKAIKNLILQGGLLTALLMIVSLPAAAVPVVYLDPAAFNNAIDGSLSQQGFNALVDDSAPGYLFETYVDTPQTYGDITVSSSKFKLHTDPRFVSEGSSAIYAAPANGSMGYGEITFTFANAINALSFDVLDLGSDVDPSTLTLTTSEGSVVVVADFSGPDGNQFFAGIIDFDTTFSSVTFDLITTAAAYQDIVSFDNFQYGNVTVSEVPLPAGLPLYALSLSLLALFKRKKD